MKYIVKVKRVGISFAGTLPPYISSNEIFDIYFNSDPVDEIVLIKQEFSSYDEAEQFFYGCYGAIATIYDIDSKMLIAQFVVLSQIENEKSDIGYVSTIDTCFAGLRNIA